MEEQEDEIKKLNELILNAKCHAIRDNQLIEKMEIKKEILEEDKRYKTSVLTSRYFNNSLTLSLFYLWSILSYNTGWHRKMTV